MSIMKDNNINNLPISNLLSQIDPLKKKKPFKVNSD